MGLNILLHTKYQEDSCRSQFSRQFCDLISGRDNWENSEFNQIEKLLEIDLSIFKKSPINLEANTHELYYHFYLAENKNDSSNIEGIKNQIEQVKKEWKESYDLINEGWTEIKELRNNVEKLKSKILSNPHYYQMLNYNFDWFGYFDNTHYSMINNSFLMKDIDKILEYLDCIEANGHKLVSFVYL